MALNRRKSAKNIVDLIRRKFSIDAEFAIIAARAPFRNHAEPGSGNLAFTICAE
jgi:hypothetical protein